MSKTPPNVDQKEQKKQRALTITGIVLCLLLLPILIVNVTLIVKSYINTDEVPSIGGISPLIVLTDSMLPKISSGDLIITKQIDPADVKVGDVISFFDPAGNGSSVVTHRVIEIVTENGETKWRTRGDNNNTEDRVAVPFDNLVGIWTGTRIGGAGSVAMFLQTTPGLIVCIGCPLALLVGYDVLRRRKYDKAKQEDTDALLKELEALRAMQAEKSKSETEQE
jgi:signal peptidase